MLRIKKAGRFFEVVFGLPFLTAIRLQRFLPIALPRGWPTYLMFTMGVILTLAGVTFVVLARREFALFGQPTDQGLAASRILTNGFSPISEIRFTWAAYSFGRDIFHLSIDLGVDLACAGHRNVSLHPRRTGRNLFSREIWRGLS